jgi:excisionase family DNA binding protein
MTAIALIKRRPAAVRRFRLGDWMSAPEWITVKEAAGLAGYHVNYIQRLVRASKVKAEKRSGHDWWIDKASLQAYVKTMKSLGSDKFNPHRNGD